jgi:alanine racemase
MESKHRSWIEISQSSLQHNIALLTTISHPAGFAAVIKGNAYGHGLVPIAHLLQDIPTISYLCTAGIEEAGLLRSCGIQKPILALIPSPEEFSQAIEYNIDIMVQSIADLRHITRIVFNRNIMARIHIKIDTGLSRLGITLDEIPQFMKELQFCQQKITLAGAFTHLADTNSKDLSFTHTQLQKFNTVLQSLKANGHYHIRPHVLASGSLTFPFNSAHTQDHLVRVGTALYGLWKSPLQQQRFLAHMPQAFLQPILSWKTTIIHITTTYNISLNQLQRIAIIPIGYRDGFPPNLANKASVCIHNHEAPIINIFVSSLAINVTHIVTAAVGVLVTVIGKHPATAASLADKAGMLHNELLSRINPAIPRIVTE